MTAIFAADENWGIGKDGGLPWPHNEEDMKWFRKTTLDNTVVMGRKTYESLGMEKGLDRRLNIVVSDTMEMTGSEFDQFLVRPMDVFMEDFPLSPIWTGPFPKVFMIGGVKMMEVCKPWIKNVWISRIAGDYECDTFLDKDWITENFVKKELYHPSLNLEYWEIKE